MMPVPEGHQELMASFRDCSRGSMAATGMMAQLIERLLPKHEDLSSDWQKSHKTRLRSVPVFLVLGGRDKAAWQ